MMWAIPREWVGQTVAVMASGPSMSQAVADQVRAARIPAIAVNNTFRLAPWADILYAADEAWWQHTPGALQFEGLKVTISPAIEAPSPIRGVLTLGNAGREGYTDETDRVHSLGNSGAQAIQVAAKAGARRILLCGFDMAGGHWHAEHPTPLRQTGQDMYAIWRQRYEGLAAALVSRGTEVLNCSPDSALTWFRKVRLEDALAACAVAHP